MGYTTDFSGSLTLSRPATEVERNYINLINRTRRMKRDVNKLMELYGGKHGHPTPKSDKPEDIYGNDGEYFAKDDGDMGQNRDASIIDYNIAPGHKTWEQTQGEDFNKTWADKNALIASGKCQPGLWCQWEITEDGTELQWDGGEKFYHYVDWLKYLINNFFEPWGIKLNGEIEWIGEDPSDRGKIVANDNEVKVFIGKITYTMVEEGTDTDD